MFSSYEGGTYLGKFASRGHALKITVTNAREIPVLYLLYVLKLLIIARATS